MNDLTALIKQWKNSALELREAERLITLLIVDGGRMEREIDRLNRALQEIINLPAARQDEASCIALGAVAAEV